MANQSSDVVVAPVAAPTCMESFNRVSKLPVIESTVTTVTSIYEKVKDYNSLTQMAFSTAETAVEKVVEVGKPIATPIVQSLEGPIKKVDGVLCSGLDYVESKVPAVKLPPGEILYQMYTTTKDYVHDTVSPVVEKTYNMIEPAVKTAYGKVEPIVKNAYEKVEPAMKSAYEKVEPAVETAKHALEPTYEKARDFVEPYVQPALEKVEEYFHTKCTNKHAEGQETCEECKPLKENENTEESQ